MVVIEFQELHFVITFRAIQRVIAAGEENGGPPLREPSLNPVFFFRNDTVQF